MKNKSGNKIVASNKKAYHNYFILDTVEAGISLQGWEIKSARAGTINLAESFVSFKIGANGVPQATLKQAHFSPYNFGDVANQDYTRPRPLLLHAHQLRKFHEQIAQKGLTCVVTKLYLSRGILKAEVAIARGKQNYDKKQTLKERDIKREAEREVRTKFG